MTLFFGKNSDDKIIYSSRTPLIIQHEEENNLKEEEKYEISFAFLVFDEKAKKYTINNIANYFYGCEYFHVEVYFPRTKETCSIDYDNPVYFCKNKNYYSREWDWLTIPVTRYQHTKFYKFCQMKQGNHFDKLSLWCFCFGSLCQNPGSNTKWNCARLFTTGLIESKILFTHLDSNFITVDDLYKSIQTNCLNVKQYKTSK